MGSGEGGVGDRQRQEIMQVAKRRSRHRRGGTSKAGRAQASAHAWGEGSPKACPQGWLCPWDRERKHSNLLPKELLNREGIYIYHLGTLTYAENKGNKKGGGRWFRVVSTATKCVPKPSTCCKGCCFSIYQKILNKKMCEKFGDVYTSRKCNKVSQGRYWSYCAKEPTPSLCALHLAWQQPLTRLSKPHFMLLTWLREFANLKYRTIKGSLFYTILECVDLCSCLVSF